MIEQVAKERITICEGCPFYSENRKKEGYKTLRPDAHCIACGCTLSAKTRCLSCECPNKRWESVVNQEESDKIKLEVNG